MAFSSLSSPSSRSASTVKMCHPCLCCMRFSFGTYVMLPILHPFFHLKLVPPLFLYLLIYVSATGEVAVTSMLSLEVGVKLLLLKWEFYCCHWWWELCYHPCCNCSNDDPRGEGEGLIMCGIFWSPLEDCL